VKLLDAKLKYKHLYKFKDDDGFIAIFRPLSYKEFNIAASLLGGSVILVEDLKDEIVNLCFLQTNFLADELNDFKGEFDNDVLPAGYIDSIFNAIMLVSGPTSLEDLGDDLNVGRMDYEYDFMEQILSLVCNILSLSRSEVEDMAWPDIVQKIVSAENIFLGAVPSVPFGPKEELTLEEEIKQERKNA